MEETKYEWEKKREKHIRMCKHLYPLYIFLFNIQCNSLKHSYDNLILHCSVSSASTNPVACTSCILSVYGVHTHCQAKTLRINVLHMCGLEFVRMFCDFFLFFWRHTSENLYGLLPILGTARQRLQWKTEPRDVLWSHTGKHVTVFQLWIWIHSSLLEW